MLARRVHRTGRPFDVGRWWEGPPGVLLPYTEFRHMAFARAPSPSAFGAAQAAPAIWAIICSSAA